MNLEFNDYIFDDITTKEILEEVIYTISLSAKENYDIDKVVLKNKAKEICQTKVKENTCKK